MPKGGRWRTPHADASVRVQDRSTAIILAGVGAGIEEEARDIWKHFESPPSVQDVLSADVDTPAVATAAVGWGRLAVDAPLLDGAIAVQELRRGHQLRIRAR